MRWLSIELVETDERSSFWVPCPDDELARMVCSVSTDPIAVAGALRLNPGLLIFSLVEFRNQQHQAAQSGAELVTWCQANLIRALADSSQECRDGRLAVVQRTWSRFSKKEQLSFFKKYLRARSNSKLRKSLSRFVGHVEGGRSADWKRLLSQIVGKRMRADELECKRIRKKKTLARVVSRLESGVDHGFDITNLIRIVADHQSLESHFSERLMEEKLAAMKQLAYGASHEINNPLANISTRAQTMLACETNPEKRHKLSVIYEQAIRAHEMISDMMLFAHPPVIERNLVSLRLLMFKIVNEMSSIVESRRGVDLVVIIGPGVDRVNIDPVHVSVAIKNLIRNSVEALAASHQPRGRIEIRVTRDDDSQIEISVSDDGIGITGEVARHLFDPFYSGREAGRGLGFGLCKSWAIAKLHGGCLRWDEQAEWGTRFVIELPGTPAEWGNETLAGLTICPKTQERDEEAA